MRNMFVMASILFCFYGTSCKKDIVDPLPDQLPADTTSHNFTIMRIDTLGDLFSSARAVDIVNENNIWVAGEFYEKDTANNYNLKYNLAHWNGLKWNLIGIKMQGIGGIRDTSIQPLIAVKAFSDSSIVVISQYNSYARWDGKEWFSYTVDPKIGYVQHFWARSPNEIYFVGGFGSATYFNGQAFTKMTTGLTTNALLTDVWGDENNVYTLGNSNDMKTNVILYTGNTSSWIVANSYSIENKTPAPPNKYMGGLLSTFRANKSSKLWVLGGEDHGSLFEITSLSPFSSKDFFVIPDTFYPKYVRGNADNDLFLFGSHGEIWHYNAKTWKFIESVNNFRMMGCSVKGNTIVLTGESSDQLLGKGITVILQRH